MGWCPSCKNEFVEGITICPKCDVQLVNSLDEANEKGKVLEKMEEEKKIRKPGESTWDFEAGNKKDSSGYSMSVLPMVGNNEGIADGDISEAEKAAQARRAMAVRKAGAPQVYQDKGEQAKEVKGSAYALLLVGILGLVVTVLIYKGVIHLNQSKIYNDMFCAAMALMFVALIIGSFLSMKSFKKLAQSASEEDQLSAQIEKWYKEKLSKELVDNAVSRFVDADDAEEEKYFPRIACIKAILVESFVNLDSLYADHMVEEIYNYLYED